MVVQGLQGKGKAKSRGKAKGQGKGQSKAKGRGKGRGRGRGKSVDDAAEDLAEMHEPAAPEAAVPEDLVLVGWAASTMDQAEDVGVASGASAAVQQQAALEAVMGVAAGSLAGRGL